MFQLGDVVLLEYPYADLIGVKLRPAVVLIDTLDGDIIVARATSQSKQSAFDIAIEDWQVAGFLKPSIARMHKLATLEKNMVKRKMGKLSPKDLSKISSSLKTLFSV